MTSTHPWGKAAHPQEKLIGQLGDVYLSDCALYNQGSSSDIQAYDYAKIVRTSPVVLFAVSILLAVLCVWAGLSGFNAWVRFDTSAMWTFAALFYQSDRFAFADGFWSVFHSSTTFMWWTFFITLILSIAGFYVYKKLKRTWLDVFFDHEKVRLNVTTFDPLEVSKFQRSLRIVKNGRYADL